MAPLVCVGLGALTVWLCQRWRWLGITFAVAFAAFGVMRTVRYLTEKFIFET